jgi:hypothetical protein
MEEHSGWCSLLARFRESPAARDLGSTEALEAFAAAGGTEEQWCRLHADELEDARRSVQVRAQALASGREVRPVLARPPVVGALAPGLGCTGRVVPFSDRPFSPWPSLAQRLRGDFLPYAQDARQVERLGVAGKYGVGCCSWTEVEGCRWYPDNPRCSLRTREVVRPPCFGYFAWHEDDLRRVEVQLADTGGHCLDPEGFLRTGRDCATCPDRQDRLFRDWEADPDPSTLEAVC